MSSWVQLAQAGGTEDVCLPTGRGGLLKLQAQPIATTLNETPPYGREKLIIMMMIIIIIIIVRNKYRQMKATF